MELPVVGQKRHETASKVGGLRKAVTLYIRSLHHAARITRFGKFS